MHSRIVSDQVTAVASAALTYAVCALLHVDRPVGLGVAIGTYVLLTLSFIAYGRHRRTLQPEWDAARKAEVARIAPERTSRTPSRRRRLNAA